MSGYARIDTGLVDLRAPMDYETARKVIATGRSHGRRKLQNNTYLEHIDEHTVGFRLHDTHVVKLHDDGTATLDTGGWYTTTTKQRINSYIPERMRVGSFQGRWYLCDDDWNRTARFFDGMRLTADGTVVNPRPRSETEAQERYEEDTLKAMNKYIRKFLRALRDGIPMPGPGDCWGCTSKDALGNDHLLSHFEEDYFVPSLLTNAYSERGYGDWRLVFSTVFDYEWFVNEEGIRLRRKHGTDEPDVGRYQMMDIGRILRRYLKPRVLPELAR